jgi:hypothetical protein
MMRRMISSQRLLPVDHRNGVVRLIICVDAFNAKSVGLTGNNYRLANLHCFTLSETNPIYGVADPGVGG